MAMSLKVESLRPVLVWQILERKGHLVVVVRVLIRIDFNSHVNTDPGRL